MATEHKFRYLLKPGNDFKLIKQMPAWCIVSFLLCTAAIGSLFVNKAVRGDYMNWTIDFKGGTEVVYKFVDKDSGEPVTADPAKVRAAISGLGVQGFDVSDYSFKEKGRQIHGMTVRTPHFGALTPAQAQTALDAFNAAFADRGLEKVQWSGDRLFVRSTQLIDEAKVAETLAPLELELKPVEEGQAKLNTAPNEDTGEYNATFTVWGSTASTSAPSRRSSATSTRRSCSRTASAPRPATSSATTASRPSSTRWR